MIFKKYFTLLCALGTMHLNAMNFAEKAIHKLKKAPSARTSLAAAFKKELNLGKSNWNTESILWYAMFSLHYAYCAELNSNVLFLPASNYLSTNIEIFDKTYVPSDVIHRINLDTPEKRQENGVKVFEILIASLHLE